MLRHRLVQGAVGCCLLLVFWVQSGMTQDYGNRFGERQAGEVGFRPQGPWVTMGDIEPAVRKHYLPQELLREYRWQTWDYTNYATNLYQRYREPNLEGNYFYDNFGNFLTRGWLVYDWTEERPRTSEGSRVLKRGEYAGYFGQASIAGDQKGEYSYAITIGNELRTTLTPMTFHKAVYNGTQIDFYSDNYSVTGLFSRISAPGFRVDPNPASFNSFTNLSGGRAQVAVGDNVTLGATFVNAHSGRATLESFTGNPFKGALTDKQLETANQITSIVVRISDDSPADGRGGATLLADDVEIRTRLGMRDTVLVGSAIGFTSKREGGVIREGARVADGYDLVTLRYDLLDLQAIIDDIDIVNNIRGVRLKLVLVNDYKIEVTSNVQNNREKQPVFVVVAQAEGNVKDGSNKKQVVFDYGLPTANQIYGFTVEVADLMGFSLFGEYDVNHRYRQYPNGRDETHRSHSGIVGDESAHAWMINLARVFHPWFFFAEVFYMEEEYTTSPYIVDGFGLIDYEDETSSLYDFVDDNDDQDRKPDQRRLFQDPRSAQEQGAGGLAAEGVADEAIFPGWDENNDFISDFNQNNSIYQENLFPDYDEPFLRFGSDRPEFLFGIDLNNNGWVDRFENDDEPDYPYKRDHKGYNVYLQNRPMPHASVSVGQTREWVISDDRRSLTTYGLLAFERDFPGIGKVRFFDMLKRAEDDIQDDLSQWVQMPREPGLQRPIADPLFARDAWINTAWVGFERRSNSGVNFVNKLKYEIVHQGQDSTLVAVKENTRFLGMINKVDALYHWETLTIKPRFKSEFLRSNVPYSISRGERLEREDWSGTFYLLVGFPLMWKTTIEMGVEQMLFHDMLLEEKPLLDNEGNPTGNFQEGDETGDFRNTVAAVQLSNIGAYSGYKLITQLGFRLDRMSRERFEAKRKTETGNFVYLTMLASIRE